MPLLQKPEPRARVKARKQRHAAKVVKSVRQQCMERDGYCRIGNWEDNPGDFHDDALNSIFCEGRSEWAHLGEKRRFRTRGLLPERRHTTQGSLMLCTEHHQAYDARQLSITAMTDIGADGPLKCELR